MNGVCGIVKTRVTNQEVVDLSEKLKYPILLVHGMGFRDNKYIGYWGRIPNALEEMGCKIYFGN